MEIILDEAAVNEAINENINRAVADALSGYQVREAVAKTITAQVANGVIGEAIAKVIAAIDIDALTQRLAEEMTRATTGCAIRFLRESFANSLINLRGHYLNESDRKAEVARIVAEMKAERGDK